MTTRAGNGDTARRTPEVPRSGRWDELWTRVQSAAVLGAVILVATYEGGFIFAGIIAVLAVIMIQEWDQICENRGIGPVRSAHAWFVAAALIFAGAGGFVETVPLVLLAVLIVVVRALYRGHSVLWPVLGVLYVAVPCASVVWLRADEAHGMVIVFWSFAVVWATDSGAYMFGKSIGGPRLAPSISPKKTWAGLVGGTLCGTAAGAVVAATTGYASVGLLAALSFILTFAAHAGDLCESALKRKFGVKDSGVLIPGHGGFLDRVDGLVFVWPTMVIIQFLHGGPLLPWVS